MNALSILLVFAGLTLIVALYILWGLAKVRSELSTALGLLKWLWQAELKKRNRSDR